MNFFVRDMGGFLLIGTVGGAPGWEPGTLVPRKGGAVVLRAREEKVKKLS
jgi:hypothetical protein